VTIKSGSSLRKSPWNRAPSKSNGVWAPPLWGTHGVGLFSVPRYVE